MNIQTFLYNENFYKKLALTVAIIRLTPSHLSPKDYTIQLQNIFRRNQINESIQYEQVLLDIRSLRKSISIKIPTKTFDLLEYYADFLQTLFTRSTEFNIEIQTMIIETIERVFELIKENFFHEKYQTILKKLIYIILNYDIISNIQKHSIQHIRDFIDLVLIYINQSTMNTTAQIFIEQIGIYNSYFLLVFERILAELIIYLNQSNSNSTYGFILVNILEKIVEFNDSNTLEQILNNQSVRQQFHALLYICLSVNNNDNSLVISLWNIYGRIL
jgi:hypothetical protein